MQVPSIPFLRFIHSVGRDYSTENEANVLQARRHEAAGYLVAAFDGLSKGKDAIGRERGCVVIGLTPKGLALLQVS